MRSNGCPIQTPFEAKLSQPALCLVQGRPYVWLLRSPRNSCHTVQWLCHPNTLCCSRLPVWCRTDLTEGSYVFITFPVMRSNGFSIRTPSAAAGFMFGSSWILRKALAITSQFLSCGPMASPSGHPFNQFAAAGFMVVRSVAGQISCKALAIHLCILKSAPMRMPSFLLDVGNSTSPSFYFTSAGSDVLSLCCLCRRHPFRFEPPFPFRRRRDHVQRSNVHFRHRCVRTNPSGAARASITSSKG